MGVGKRIGGSGARVPVGIWLAFGILLAVGALSLFTTTRLVRAIDLASDTSEMVGTLNAVDASMSEMESARRAYSISGEESYLQTFSTASAKLYTSLVNVTLLARGAEHQRELNQQLATLVTQRVRLLRAAIENRRTLGFDAQRDSAAMRNGVHVREQVRAVIAEMRSGEELRLVQREKTAAGDVDWLRMVQIGGTLVGILILTMAFAHLRREVRRRHVSEQAAKESELNLSTMLHSIGDGVIATDAHGRVTRMNPQAEVLTGWRERDALGRAFEDVCVLVNAETREPVTGPIRMALAKRSVVGRAAEMVLVSRDGTLRPIADSAAPIVNYAGQVTGVVLVFRDSTEENAWKERIREANSRLTRVNEDLEQRVEVRTAELLETNRSLTREIEERQQATDALKQTEAQLRQAQKMEAIGRLAGGIAHDFNNLLMVIITVSELLLEDPEFQQRSDVEEITKAAQRAADLTRQLLAFSRQQILAPKVVELNTVVAGMEKMLARVIGENVELAADLTPGLPNVEVDPSQLEQVVMNLVVNARDAMPQGGRVSISTELANEPGHVVLSVRDTGTGMDAQTQTRIFEPFYTTKEVGKGTGLGLATVLGIVQQSGGTITVESEPGSGTTFRVYLPTVNAQRTSLRRTTRKGPALGHETILLVEDETAVRSMFRSILARVGYTVLEACDGVEALEVAAAHPSRIHLILTDLMMPRMGGGELAERIELVHPEAKLLFMSGYTDDRVIQDGGLLRGAFLQKPFPPDLLRRKVREVLSVADASAARS